MHLSLSALLWSRVVRRPSVVVNFSHFTTCLVSILLKHFLLLLCNVWTESDETWQEARTHRPLPSFFLGGGVGLPIGKRWPSRPLIDWYFFEYFSGITERNLIKLDKEQVLKWRSKTKDNPLADPSRKMAYCTRVHDMWPFWIPFLVHFHWQMGI